MEGVSIGAQSVVQAEIEVTASVLVQSLECPPGPLSSEHCQLYCLTRGRQNPTIPDFLRDNSDEKIGPFFLTIPAMSIF